jgi:hypothetical protein
VRAYVGAYIIETHLLLICEQDIHDAYQQFNVIGGPGPMLFYASTYVLVVGIDDHGAIMASDQLVRYQDFVFLWAAKASADRCWKSTML